MHKKKCIVSSCYKFVDLRNPGVIKKKLLINLKKLDIRGTFILGKEGINASFSISAQQFEKVKSSIQNLISTEIKFKKPRSNNFFAKIRSPISAISDKICFGKTSAKSFVTPPSGVSPIFT